MNDTVGHRVIVLKHTRILIHVVDEVVVIHHIRVARPYDEGIQHVHTYRSFRHVRSEVGATTHDVGTGNRVANTLGYAVY